MPPDAWAELARLFREESARHPELRHILVELPEAVEIPVNPEDEGDQVREARTAQWERLNPAFIMAALVAGDTRFGKRTIRVASHHLAQEHVFHGAPTGLDSPSWG